MHNTFYILILLIFASCNLKKEPKNQDQLEKEINFSVLTFNMWHGGEAEKKPLDKSIEVILESGASIVGLQEAYAQSEDGSMCNNGLKMAQKLGWNHLDQGGSGIISKYEICDTTSTKKGVKLKIDTNKYIWFFNCHLHYIPYQPYQLANKEYGDYPFISTEKEAIHYAEMARMHQVQDYVKEIQTIVNDGWPIILTGDFNEPSFLDWTNENSEKGLFPIKVEWPATKAFADIGMKDSYRMIYPDVEKYPGKTWSSFDSPGEIHDRIDFILYMGHIIPFDAKTIGFEDNISNIAINNYPSDHRAVCVNFKWEKK